MLDSGSSVQEPSGSAERIQYVQSPVSEEVYVHEPLNQDIVGPVYPDTLTSSQLPSDSTFYERCTPADYEPLTNFGSYIMEGKLTGYCSASPVETRGGVLVSNRSHHVFP